MRASYDPRAHSARHRHYVGNGTVGMHVISVASTTARATGTAVSRTERHGNLTSAIPGQAVDKYDNAIRRQDVAKPRYAHTDHSVAGYA